MVIHTAPLIFPAPPAIPKEKSAIFDVDDTLWPQTDRAYRGTPYRIDMMDTFSVTENKAFSAEDAEKILKIFEDPAAFTDMEFYPSVKKIKFLFDIGVRVGLKTDSLSHEVANTKFPQLQAAFPYLQKEDIRMRVREHGQLASGKNIGREVTFFVDDNPHNIVKSDAYINILPARPWNTSPKEILRMSGKRFYIMQDLDVIIDSIFLSVLAWHQLL